MLAFTEDEILQGIAAGRDDIPNYGAMKRDGVLKIRLDEPVVSFKEQIKNPEKDSIGPLSGVIPVLEVKFWFISLTCPIKNEKAKTANPIKIAPPIIEFFTSTSFWVAKHRTQ